MLLQATLPGAPCTYYGDEIGLEGGLDPDSRRSFPRDQAAWDRDVMEFVRASIALRHDEAALRRGSFRVAAAGAGGMAFERVLGEERLVVALNAAEAEVSLDVDLPGANGCRLEPRPLPGVAAATGTVVDGRGHARVVVTARSGAVFRLA
jgi:cyclomaltodextrinase / maltogenic alpha-amylase / neopullulanase